MPDRFFETCQITHQPYQLYQNQQKIHPKIHLKIHKNSQANETHLSAKPDKTQTYPRVSCENGHQGRSRSIKTAAAEKTGQAQSLGGFTKRFTRQFYRADLIAEPLAT